MKLNIWAYNPGSQSANLLADALNVKIIRHSNSKYKWRENKVILNWGSTNTSVGPGKWINRPDKVAIATNKLTAFQKFQDGNVRTVPWTTEQGVAQGWLAEGKTVVARTVLNGSEGRGIVIVKPGDILPQASLYTQYVKKIAEYRVHVMSGQVLDIQQKVKRSNEDNRDFHVRNTANGFVFKRNGVVIPPDCVAQSLLAVRALGLDFGAVDVIWNAHKQEAYVLEVNTAPGIEGTTVQKYKEGLERLIALRDM